MPSPTSPTITIRDPEANIPTRQRTHLLPLNEDGLISPNSSESSPHHSQPSPGTASQKRRSIITQNIQENKEGLVRYWNRFSRKGKKNIGVTVSLRALLLSSRLNILLLMIPLAWVSRFLHWSHTTTFTLSFFAIIPLERLFEYGGGQMAYYLGKDLGDLLTITLNNVVEATLAIILLQKCQLQLLKSTIVGVVILHLLLVPGTAFVTGGARIIQQDLHAHSTELNHSLLTLGVLSLLLPAAFFAALDTSFSSSGGTISTPTTPNIFDNQFQETLLKISRGIAVLLLIVYVCSRIYLHNPPGEANGPPVLIVTPEVKALRALLQNTDPEVNQWVCLAMLTICIGLLAATAEWLVGSIEFVRDEAKIELEWFGLILLPIVSFAGDGVLAVSYFVLYMFSHFFREPTPPTTLARAEAIDLSIQFTLFWMPFFVLLGWWTNKPLTLLFDLFEVSVIIGSCFIVNYVTADSKTNWAEGVSMISFYCMIALCAWFYHGQPETTFLSQLECPSGAALAV